MYTGTRLTTAINRRLFSRFSEGGGMSVHRLSNPSLGQLESFQNYEGFSIVLLKILAAI